MKRVPKTASPKARARLKKLQALAERGVGGEKLAAQRKIERLKARFDFSSPGPEETPDLFQGVFKPSSHARKIGSFSQDEVDIANAVKWAIASATGIRCLYRGCDLFAEATPATANRLARIAGHIGQSFRALTAQFHALEGVSPADHRVFVLGLYDGMMNETRDTGQALPGRPGTKKRKRQARPSPSSARGLHVHPYALAVGLGRHIRFSVPLGEIAAELDELTRRSIAARAQPRPPLEIHI